MAKVTEVTITDISPKVKNPEIAKLLPKTLFPKRLEFQISPVSNAVSNALRRTVECELLVKALWVDLEDFETNDMFHIQEMIMERFRMIPIDQNTPLDTIFELSATNDTATVRDVKSSEIRIHYTSGKGSALKKLPFNETFTLFTLNPGKTVKIKKITIHSAYGFTSGDGMHAVAVNAASIAIDQIPINHYEGVGIPSSISNARVWKISFNTNGTMEPKAIVAAACDNIIARVETVHELLYSIENNGDEYLLIINGESHTIGNLFMRTIVDLFPDIRAVTYTTANVGRVCSIRIRCDEDINTVYEVAVKYLVNLFTDIKKYFD